MINILTITDDMISGENNNTVTNRKHLSYVTVSGIVLTEVIKIMTINQNKQLHIFQLHLMYCSNCPTNVVYTYTIKENLSFQFLLSAVWLPYSVFYIELVHLGATSTTQGLWVPIVITGSRSIFSKFKKEPTFSALSSRLRESHTFLTFHLWSLVSSIIFRSA